MFCQYALFTVLLSVDSAVHYVSVPIYSFLRCMQHINDAFYMRSVVFLFPPYVLGLLRLLVWGTFWTRQMSLWRGMFISASLLHHTREDTKRHRFSGIMTTHDSDSSDGFNQST